MMFLSRVFSKPFSQQFTTSGFYSAEYVFSQDNIQRTLTNFSKINFPVSRKEPRGKAAILIPICEVDGQVSLLYTLRAANLKSHRGQVSFPGGKCDKIDKSIEETAMRETVEELGITNDQIELWGRGKWLTTKYETAVTPVIGRIKGNVVLSDLKTNPTEVEEVFTVTLQELCIPENLKYTQFRILMARTPSSTPVFLGGKHRIWGLTAYFTHMFLKCLLPTEAYKHPLKFVPPIQFSRPVLDE